MYLSTGWLKILKKKFLRQFKLLARIDEFVKGPIHQVFGVWYEIGDAISACSNTKH